MHYYLTSLAAGETRAIDIRQLRDAQVADFKGHVIPRNASDGSVTWIRLDDVPVSGCVMVISRTAGVASSKRLTRACPRFRGRSWRKTLS